MEQRVAGVLCPVSMLPSRFGIGDFGKSSRAFVDLAAEMGMKLWQILPLNPLGYGHSPYQPFSSFAIDDLYMDLDALYEEGLLAEPAPDEPGVEPGKVDYEKTKAFKTPYIEKAYKAFMKKEGAAATLNAFMREHPWCKVYALFMYLKKGEGMRSWAEWPKEKKDRISSLAYKNTAERTGRLFETWIQYELYREWDLLREYAHGKGIKIVGDVPFYVGYDSADVYENRDKFLLDPVTLEPTFIAGVPPDYFSATGQRWGNPIYDWDKLKDEDYELVVNRLRRNGELYDIVRLDHFRAFDTSLFLPDGRRGRVDPRPRDLLLRPLPQEVPEYRDHRRGPRRPPPGGPRPPRPLCLPGDERRGIHLRRRPQGQESRPEQHGGLPRDPRQRSDEGLPRVPPSRPLPLLDGADPRQRL